MKRLTASAFPELNRVFTAYLHEDLVPEHGTPEAALRAFEADADPGERRRFRKEAERFVDRTSTLDFAQVRALLIELGCRWIPPTRDALVALLTSVSGH